MDSSLVKLLILSILIGITKAHTFRTMVFAVLGLAGLWMMNSVARSSSGLGGLEDRSLFPNFSVANLANRFLTKRSVDDIPPVKVQLHQLDWELVLSHDTSTCTRSYVCQLSASNLEELHLEEKFILEFIRQSQQEETSTWAKKQIHIAANNGEKWRNKASCMKVYKKCPYSRETMRSLLNAFDGRRTNDN